MLPVILFDSLPPLHPLANQFSHPVNLDLIRHFGHCKLLVSAPFFMTIPAVFSRRVALGSFPSHTFCSLLIFGPKCKNLQHNR